MECFTFKIDDGTFEIEFVENEEYENINYYIKFSTLMDDEKIKKIKEIIKLLNEEYIFKIVKEEKHKIITQSYFL